MKFMIDMYLVQATSKLLCFICNVLCEHLFQQPYKLKGLDMKDMKDCVCVGGPQSCTLKACYATR